MTRSVHQILKHYYYYFSFGTLFVRKYYVMLSKVYSTLSWYLNEVLDMGGSFYKGTREYLGKEFKPDQLLLA